MKPSSQTYLRQRGSFSDWCRANDKTDLIAEWLTDRNSGIGPDMVTSGTNQNAYWRCSICGHEWPASPKTRKNGHGCPECKKRLLSEKRLGYALRSSQSLEEWCLVKSRQDMLNEWSLKNTCLPDEITYGSKKSVLWICKKCGTEWPAAPSSRTGRGDGCPACAGKQVNAFNHIGAVYPHLVEEWHSKKNGAIQPDSVCANSHEEYWWLCSRGHEWLASPNTRSKSGCPYCSSRKVLEGFNDLATVNPDLAAQWHGEKNKILPSEVTSFSNKTVWWICDNGDEWPATVASRSEGNGCPICSNKKLKIGRNDLATVRPDLANQLSKKNTLTASQIIAGSNSQMIWICEKGHEWKAAVSDRARGNECPVCQNRKLLKGYNDLAFRYPKIASEWDYERNNGKLPEDVIFSSGHRYHWRCSRNHRWPATAKSRTQNNTGCPKCNAYTQSSFPQEAVIFYLSKAFNVVARKKVAGKELDAYLMDYKIGVEYDGWWWHSFDEVNDRDNSKNATMKEAGVSLYRIAESIHFNYDRSNQRIEYPYTKDCSSLKKPIDLLLRWLSEETGVNCSEISVDCIRDRQFIDTQMNRGSLANSFGERSSKYLVEWHPTKNRGLTPFQFTAFSGKRVWWKCSFCGRDWEASFADRSYSKGLGCPLCSMSHAATDRCRRVLQFDLDGTKKREWNSVKEAVSVTGIKTIAGACRGDQKTAGGYIWHYAYKL